MLGHGSSPKPRQPSKASTYEVLPRCRKDAAEIWPRWPLPHLESLAAHLWVPHAVVEVDLGVELRAELGENLRDIAEISPRYRRDAAVMPP